MKAITDSSIIFWLSCFLCGIVSGLSQHWIELLLGSCFLFYIGLLFFRRYPNVRIYLIFAPMFFVLGLWSMERVFPQKNSLLTSGTNFYIGKIERIATTNKLWNTNIIRLYIIRNRDNQWTKSNERVLLLVENKTRDSQQTFQQNDLILFKTKFQEIEKNNNIGEFNIQKYWYSKGIRYQGFGANQHVSLIEGGDTGWFDNLLHVVRNYSTKVLDDWIGVNDSPLLKALLLGDKSDLDTDTKRIFMNTGAMHMLAVSGMHVGLIVVILELFFKMLFFYRGKNTVAWLMIFILWFYAFLTGFSASVTRAVVMFTVLIFSRMFKRQYQPINSLCIAAFVILIYNPMSVFDIGFQLSFLAMVGIFTIYPILQNAVTFRYNILNTIWQGTAVGLAAQVFTLPLSLYYFHQFPNYFILTNIGVMLFSGLLLGLSIALLLIGKIPLLSAPLGWIVALCASIFIGFIGFIETLPGALALGFSPSFEWIIILYTLLALCLYWVDKKMWIRIVIAILPLFTWIQIERLENMSKKEWVVFNSKYTIVLFNNAGKQVCLYENKPQSQKQAYRLIEDYKKIHPGTTEFHPIFGTKYKINTNNRVFHIKFDSNIMTIETDDQDYAFIDSENSALELSSKKKTIISKGNLSQYVSHNLENGAYRQKW